MLFFFFFLFSRCRFNILLVARRGGVSFQDNEAWWLYGNKRRRREVGGRCRPSQSLLLPLFFSFFLSGSRHTGRVAGTWDRGAAFSDNQQHGDTRASEGMEKVTLMESNELLKKKPKKTKVTAADKKKWRKNEVQPESGSGANVRRASK